MERTMARRDNFYGSRARRCLLLLAAAILSIPGCASLKAGQGSGAAVKTIWQSRDQFVALERQDHHPGLTVQANAHPADIPVERLNRILESIMVKVPGDEQPIRLFSGPDLEPVIEHLREGLAQATADEDVTFAYIGNYRALLGLMSERKVTTGRVFCQHGQINIIFGEVLRDVKENEDRRLYPFLPGSRAAGEPRKWSLAAQAGTEDLTMKRPDWVIFPVAGPVTSVPVPPVTNAKGAAGIRDNRTVKPGPAGEMPAPAARGSIEERLRVLIDLREKKLITEEEYREKRREILEGI
jgi:hypothetical protein